jgi:hypothetical protein
MGIVRITGKRYLTSEYKLIRKTISTKEESWMVLQPDFGTKSFGKIYISFKDLLFFINFLRAFAYAAGLFINMFPCICCYFPSCHDWADILLDSSFYQIRLSNYFLSCTEFKIQYSGRRLLIKMICALLAKSVFFDKCGLPPF